MPSRRTPHDSGPLQLLWENTDAYWARCYPGTRRSTRSAPAAPTPAPAARHQHWPHSHRGLSLLSLLTDSTPSTDASAVPGDATRGMAGQMDDCTEAYMDGWTGTEKDGQRNGQTDVLTKEWIYQCRLSVMKACFQSHVTKNYQCNKSLYLLFTYKRRTIRPADIRRLLLATKLED